ncbi:hypothetical protein HBO34_15935 [Pseudomonas veronii]|uniref:hypothetical protein n=1 Tax=Pseudomonas veronii TaxID=76761 RepID=UPI0014754D69|nr:hypothetical protein [Pseudomonas veronii]NMX39365.1 hypothetical protein [Pseudomonas veronii]
MTTPVELINLALKQVGVLGVGQTASAEDIADAFKMLNMMLAQWSVKRNVVYQIVDVPCLATGAQTYSVGVGADFDTPRPSKIFGAYCRQLNNPGLPVDYQLDLLQSISDYTRIATKTMGTLPSMVWYDPQMPTGVLHTWPVAISGYELHILALKPLGKFASPYDDITLPEVYEEALMYNLAGRLYPLYGMPQNPVIIALANASLATVRQSNLQIATLNMPASLMRRGKYNVYSDQ